MKTALITGIAGQDGYYLAQYLLTLGYKVHGILRPSSEQTKRMRALYNLSGDIELHLSDIRDTGFLVNLITQLSADRLEIYNLAAMSFVQTSFSNPALVFSVNTTPVATMLEHIRNLGNNIRFYQASTSEMFGNNDTHLRMSGAGFAPASPYAISKVAAHHLVRVYRESYGIHAVSGILFNHESEIRPQHFVTQKIATAVALSCREPVTLTLGNIHAKRDWGYAKDYVVAIHKMLQQPKPIDLEVGTGIQASVEDFINACKNSLPEALRVKCDQNLKIVSSAKENNRPNEVHSLVANIERTTEELKWTATHKYQELASLMTNAALINLNILALVKN